MLLNNFLRFLSMRFKSIQIFKIIACFFFYNAKFFKQSNESFNNQKIPIIINEKNYDWLNLTENQKYLLKNRNVVPYRFHLLINKIYKVRKQKKSKNCECQEEHYLIQLSKRSIFFFLLKHILVIQEYRWNLAKQSDHWESTHSISAENCKNKACYGYSMVQKCLISQIILILVPILCYSKINSQESVCEHQNVGVVLVELQKALIVFKKSKVVVNTFYRPIRLRSASNCDRVDWEYHN